MFIHLLLYLPKNNMRARDTDKEKLVTQQAIKQIAKDGFQGFSMNKLAKACNISVATLYIYYEDKDDLIKKIGLEIGDKFFSTTINGFTPDMSFADGLWKQWQNRAAFAMNHPDEVACFEAIRYSPHGEHILKSEQLARFKEIMGGFFRNALKNNELKEMQLDVYWSVAYGPLYTLLNFHREGKSMGGRPFKLTDEMMREAFETVLSALKP